MFESKEEEGKKTFPNLLCPFFVSLKVDLLDRQ
jgi:hypothetical protein